MLVLSRIRDKIGKQCGFVHGDANKLDFPDGSFDAVISNYVYHNIMGADKHALLLESLRSAYDGLYASRAGQAYMEGLPRCQIVPCAFSSEANQVGVAAAYFEAMQKKC